MSESKDASDIVTDHRANPAKLKTGDIITCLQTYVVQSCGEGRVTLKTLHGRDFSDVSTGIIAAEFYDTKATEEKRVSATTLQQMLYNHNGRPIIVGYYKKQTDVRAKEMLETLLKPENCLVDGEPRAVVTRKRRRVADAAKRLQIGALRVLEGRVISLPTSDTMAGARLLMEDFHVEADADGNRTRQVDTRTLQWVTIGGVRYIRRDYRGPCSGDSIPEHSGEVDNRAL